MEVVRQTAFVWFMTLTRIWKKQAGPRDFVWLARFRSLTVYVILKAALLLAVGLIGTRIKLTFPPGSLHFLLFYLAGTILTTGTCILFLVLGLVVASTNTHRPRSFGLLLLFIADICVVLVVMFACIIDNTFLLLLILVLTSCTTPLFVERISRYAKGYRQSEHELQRIQQTLDTMLYHYSQDLTHAIESERLVFKRKIHDGLMQDLSLAHLQVSVLLMRYTRNNKVEYSAVDFAEIEASLHRVIDDARALMQDENTA